MSAGGCRGALASAGTSAMRPRGAMITVAVARAAMPSRRPVKPRPSVVVALTLTRPSSRPSSSAMRRRMASRCGAILGASHSRVTSTLPIAPPRARTSRRASARKMAEAAPFQRGSVSGKCWPMSPSPMAPSSASVRACRATSASEWPRSVCVWAMRTPHSQTWSPGTSRCTSKPCPVRTSGVWAPAVAPRPWRGPPRW